MHRAFAYLCQGDNPQSFVWKSLEQNTQVLEKLGKRLGGRLYSATVGSCYQRLPIELDRHCEERSSEAIPGVALVRKRRSSEAVRPAKGGLSVWKGGWLVSSKGTGRGPVRELAMTVALTQQLLGNRQSAPISAIFGTISRLFSRPRQGKERGNAGNHRLRGRGPDG